MTGADLANTYRDYIACLNRRDWALLGQFVHDEVRYNEEPVGLSGYREMLVRDHAEIPDLRFGIVLLVCEPPFVASRLAFDCRPRGRFLNLDVNGRRVRFTENVFYQFHQAKIHKVWSVIDKATLEAQL